MTAAPVLYDFRRPNRFSREHVRALQIVNETFARQFSMVLSSALRVSCLVSVTNVRQDTNDEYTRSVPNPSLLAVLDFAEGDEADPALEQGQRQIVGTGVLQLPMGVVMSVVDRLLGGPGGPDQPNRALRDIEVGLVRHLLDRIVHELTVAFESLAPAAPVVEELESDPQFLQIAAPSEPVIVAEFEVRIGEQVAESTLCVPFATLQPALDAITSSRVTHRTERDGRAALAVERQLSVVPVEVAVTFNEVSVRSSQILALEVGDVLPLRHAVSQPLSVLADGIPVAVAVPGSHGQHLAAQIVAL